MSEVRVSIPKIAVAPFLSVRNGAAAIKFYKAAFGADVLFRHDGPDGSVVCELGVGEGRFWLSDESPKNRNFSPETLGGATARIVIELDDPDAMYERALTAGAKVSCPMKDEYGWRIGRVSDPFGWDWEIGKRN